MLFDLPSFYMKPEHINNVSRKLGLSWSEYSALDPLYLCTAIMFPQSTRSSVLSKSCYRDRVALADTMVQQLLAIMTRMFICS